MTTPLPALGLDFMAVPPRPIPTSGMMPRRPRSGGGPSSYTLGGRQYSAMSVRTGSASVTRGSSSSGAKTARPATTGSNSIQVSDSNLPSSKPIPGSHHATKATSGGLPPPPSSGDHPLPEDTANNISKLPFSERQGGGSRLPSASSRSNPNYPPHPGTAAASSSPPDEDGVSWTPEQVVGGSKPTSRNNSARPGSRPLAAAGGATGTQGIHKPARMGSAASIASSQMTALTTLSDPSPDYTKLGIASTPRGRKPQLLETMEKHMTREMGILRTEDTEVYGQKLRVCRETMGMFMEQFTTYKPILAEIMLEYDRTLVEMSRATTDVNKISSKLAQQKMSHEEELYLVQQQHQETEKRYLNDFDQLLDVASAADDAKTKTTSAASTLFQEIKRLEKQHEDDLEKLRLLAFTIRESERKNRNFVKTITRMNIEAEKARGLQAEIVAKEEEMLELKLTYKDTVPRINFLTLQEDFDKKEKYWYTLERKLRRILAARGGKLESLTTLTEQLVKERDRLKNKHGDRSGATTPKPDWDSYDLDDLELIGQFQRADIRARKYDTMIGEGLLEQLEKDAASTGPPTLSVMGPTSPTANDHLGTTAGSGGIPRLVEGEEALGDDEDTIITTVDLSTSERVGVLMEKIKAQQLIIMDQNVQLLDATVAVAGPGIGGGSSGGFGGTVGSIGVGGSSMNNVLGNNTRVSSSAGGTVQGGGGAYSTAPSVMGGRGATPSHGEVSAAQSIALGMPLNGVGGGGAVTTAASGGVSGQSVHGHFGFFGTAEDLGDPSKVLLFGRGRGPSVPAYMRFEGVLEVTRQPLSSLVACASSFFHHAVRLTDTAQLPTGWEVQTWLRNFLAANHGELEGVKWGYSIHLGIEQHRHSHAVITLLAGILEGSLPFRILNDACAVVTTVQSEISAFAKTHQKKTARRKDLTELLWSLLPYKETKAHEELRVALGPTGTSAVSIESLVGEDKHPFTARLLEQGCEEGMEIYSSILKELAREAAVATSLASPTVAPLEGGGSNEDVTVGGDNGVAANGSGAPPLNSSSDIVLQANQMIPAQVVRRILKNNEPATAASVVIKFSAPAEGKVIEETQNYSIPMSVLASRLATLPIIRKRRKPVPATPGSSAVSPSAAGATPPTRSHPTILSPGTIRQQQTAERTPTTGSIFTADQVTTPGRPPRR